MLASGCGLSAEVVRVGVYQNPPKVFIDKDGKVGGFFPDIVKEIAARNDWQIEWVIDEWPTLMESLCKGDIDLLVDVAISEERNERFDFNREVVLSNWSVFYSRAGGPRLVSLMDFDRRRIAVLENSIQSIELRRTLYALQAEFEMVYRNDFVGLMDAVRDGTADYALMNQLVGYELSRRYPELVENDLVFDPVSLHFAVCTLKKEQLLHEIDSTLKELKADPESVYHDAMRRWIEPMRPQHSTVWRSLGPWVAAFAIMAILGVLGFHWLLRRRTLQLRRALAESRNLNRAMLDHQEQLRLYEFILESIPHAVWMASDSGRLGFVNKHGREFLGVDDIAGSQPPWSEYIHPDDGPGTSEKWRACVAANEQFGQEMRLMSKLDGEWHWHVVVASPFHSTIDGERKWIGISTNIDAIKAYQEELIDSRNVADAANCAKSEFLAVMSHELRTPLNAIIAPTEMLIGECKDDDQRELMEMIHSSAVQLLRLISDILDLTKIESGTRVPKPSLVQLSRYLAEELAPSVLLAEQKQLRFSINFQPGIPDYYEVDPQLLRKAVVNLVTNAVKYTDAGFVKVDCGIQTSDSKEGTQLCLIVTDSGLGIPEEFQEKVFDVFQQVDMSVSRKHEGVGLGLTIARKVSAILGGELTIERSDRHGSCFKLLIPVAVASEPDLVDGRGALAARDYDLPKSKVLLVEDDLRNRKIFELMLGRLGYEFTAVERAEDALAMLGNPAGGYPIILMDVRLPGISGIEATRRLRRLRGGEGVYVIALTAHAVSGHRDECLEAGMNAFLTKPLIVKHLQHSLENAEAALLAQMDRGSL